MGQHCVARVHLSRSVSSASSHLRAALCLLLTTSAPVVAQDAPLPQPPPPPAAASGSRKANLEDRLLEMEQANRALVDQLNSQQQRHDQQMQLLMQQMDGLRQQMGGSGSERTIPVMSAGGGPSPGSVAATPNNSSPVPGYGVSGSTAAEQRTLRAVFGPGFELMSSDGEYQLQFHQETQLDFKEFDPNGDQYARSGFVIPRARVFFNGRVTKPYEYSFSINRGFNGIDVLDAYLNVHYDDRAQLKLGRFMTPFNYEQFAIQNMWLIAPERSLFTANLGLNRMLGVQLWGNVWQKRLDYAFGVFDGPRNSFQDFNEAKDVMSYLNLRPFGDQEKGGLLRDLNIGGSFIYGAQDNPLVPKSFRTASNQSNASDADLFSPPFFIFNDGVLERGQRLFWSGHVAYFYKSLSLFADYNGGILRYVTDKKALDSVLIPANGWSIAAGYFLTGEEIERRTILEPKRPFSLKHGSFGPGAWELAARYSAMHLDPDVFTQGLANPEFWSNRAWIADLGVNWYLNRYIKVYIDWQHTEFGSPVLYHQPDLKQLTNQLFWLRVQFYF